MLLIAPKLISVLLFCCNYRRSSNPLSRSRCGRSITSRGGSVCLFLQWRIILQLHRRWDWVDNLESCGSLILSSRPVGIPRMVWMNDLGKQYLVIVILVSVLECEGFVPAAFKTAYSSKASLSRLSTNLGALPLWKCSWAGTSTRLRSYLSIRLAIVICIRPRSLVACRLPSSKVFSISAFFLI